MKESGFCERHGPRAQIGKPSLPAELLAVTQAVMPQIILRLIQHLRSHRLVYCISILLFCSLLFYCFLFFYSFPDQLEDQLQAVHEAENFITMLHEYSGMGAAMRHVMTSTLVNPEVKHVAMISLFSALCNIHFSCL